MSEGLFHDLRRGWHNAREQISLSCWQGKISKWYEQGKLDAVSYNTLSAAINDLDTFLMKDPYTDEDAAKATEMITKINNYMRRKGKEYDDARASGTLEQYIAAHNSGRDEL